MLAKVFEKLNLIDSERRLSITNLGVYVVLVKLALTQTWSLTEAATLMLALLNYGHKRHVLNSASDSDESETDSIKQELIEFQKELSGVKDRIGPLQLALGVKTTSSKVEGK